LKCILACLIGIQENQRADERSANSDTGADFHVEISSLKKSMTWMK
jgi:hypothetical protein